MKSAFTTTKTTWPTMRGPVRRTSTLQQRSFSANGWERQVSEEPIWILSDGFQQGLDREVQIKQLQGFAAANPALRHDFIQEMRATSQMRHPNLIQVCEAHLQADQPYVLLERLQGPTLQERIDQLWSQRRHMALHEVGQIITALADLVEYAHQRGVRIRNLRPDSIVLTAEGHPVLTSLGSPSILPAHARAPEELAFLSPEYLAGSAFNNQSEIYALGVLLALLLTSRLPFEGDQQTILADKQWQQTLPLLEQPTEAAMLPAPLVAVLHHATARNLDQRYESAVDFQYDLVAALTQIGAPPEAAELHGLHGLPVAPPQLQLSAAPPVAHELPMIVTPPAAAPVAAVPMIVTPPAATAATAVVTAPVAAPVAAPATAPAAAVVDVATLPMDDPMLLPGMDREEFRSALPYVILVPLPPVQDLPEITPAPAATTHHGVQMSGQLWMLLVLTVIITIGAALTLG